MSAPIHPSAPPGRLEWKRDGEYQRASNNRCLSFRESSGSMVCAAIFCVAIVGSAGWMAVQLLLTGASFVEKACSLLFFLIVAVFLYIPWLTLRSGRFVLIFDRGEAGIPGEIRLKGKTLPVASVKCLSTRFAGGGRHRAHAGAGECLHLARLLRAGGRKLVGAELPTFIVSNTKVVCGCVIEFVYDRPLCCLGIGRSKGRLSTGIDINPYLS